MSKIVVLKANIKTTNTGKTKYECIGTIDGQIDKFDMWNNPELDKEFEATVKDDPKWGKTVSVGTGSSPFRGGARQDPETQKQIIRQNGLTNAVAFCIARASHMPPDKALAYLSGGNVIMVATTFAKFSEGLINGLTEVKEEVPAPIDPDYVDIDDIGI